MLISVKVFEICVMALGLAAFFSTRIELMLVVLFLMALHSTVFSPAKYGIVPEMLPDKDLSRANALLEMSTFVAIVLGTSIGSFLFTAWKNEPWKMGVVMLAVAVAGFADQLQDHARARLRRAGAVSARIRFREVITGTKHLLKDRPLWLTVIGISYFWFLGALFQMDLLLFGSEVLKVNDLHVGLMVTAWRSGSARAACWPGGSRATRWSWAWCRWARFFMGVCSASRCMRRSASYGWSVVALALLGLASGLFIVPLNAYLQQRSESRREGPDDRDQQFLQHGGAAAGVGDAVGLARPACTSRRTS